MEKFIITHVQTGTKIIGTWEELQSLNDGNGFDRRVWRLTKYPEPEPEPLCVLLVTGMFRPYQQVPKVQVLRYYVFDPVVDLTGVYLN